MFDDDDDDSEPWFNVVNNYYFEEGNGDPVCFSVLPLKFDENGEVACLNSKKVDLQGFADNGLLRVHTEVVAWRVGLHYEQPKILVLSSEGNWIELLKPRKCYEKTVQSILTTVQMLHFVRKWPGKRKRSLLDHLYEVFNKFDNKPAEYDLKKHHSIIKLFAEKDPTLMKSKILQMFTEHTSRNIREGVGTKEPNVVSSSGDEEDLDNDSDDDYSGKEENSDDDYDCDGDDSDDQGNGDDKSNDDYSCNDDDSDDGGDIDNDGDDDGIDSRTDNLCAICDNGGKLLSCEGQCKRAFHPREKDGIETNCETLGLTTAQLKEIDHYLCKNCEYKQHQCFNCGDLEPSDGPNAKVFQCYKASCGHFYHPSCIAKLLEPYDTDGACMLEKKIAAGMSFTCTAHWCSKCGKMEDNAQKAQWLAVCRRCPVSYHKKCLPRDISFKRERGRSIRAWEVDDGIIIYCGHHELEDTTGTPFKDHIKLPSSSEMDSIRTDYMDHTPSVAEIARTRVLGKKKAKVTRKRKMNTDQGSTGTTEISNRLCREEADQTQKVAMSNSREHIIRKGRGVLKKNTTHLNLAHNDEQDNIIVEEHAEGDKNNTKSGKEKETHSGENAYGHDSIFEKDKIPGKESNKSGFTIGGFTSGPVDGRPREKLAYVKATTSNRIGTQQDCEWDGDQQVDGSYAGKQELKNPQRGDTHKGIETDTSGDKSRMKQEHKEQAADCKILNLEKNTEKFHKVQGPPCLQNHKEPGALAYNFRNCDRSSSSTSKSHPRHNDDQRALKTSESKSRDGRGSDRKEWRNNMGVNSDGGNSPLRRRYPQNIPRVYSPEGQRMDYHNNYPRSNNQHRYERRGSNDYASDGHDDRRRLSRREDYCSDGDCDRRRYRHEDYSSDGGGDMGRYRREDYSGNGDGGGDRGRYRREDYSSGDRRMSSRREDYCRDGDVGRRLSPRQSEFCPGNLSSMSCPASYPARTEYGGRRRHGSPSYGGRHDPYMNSRRPEHVGCGVDRRTAPLHGNPPNVEYDEYTDPEYGRHIARDIAPVDRYSVQEDSTGFYGGHFSDYGERSNCRRRNRLNSASAAGPVTDRYAPRLDRTNRLIRRQGGGLPDAAFPHDAW